LKSDLNSVGVGVSGENRGFLSVTEGEGTTSSVGEDTFDLVDCIFVGEFTGAGEIKSGGE